jgi:hypothetical protein
MVPLLRGPVPCCIYVYLMVRVHWHVKPNRPSVFRFSATGYSFEAAAPLDLDTSYRWKQNWLYLAVFWLYLIVSGCIYVYLR